MFFAQFLVYPWNFNEFYLTPWNFPLISSTGGGGITIFFLEKSDSKDRLTSTSIRMINVLIINLTNTIKLDTHDMALINQLKKKHGSM